MGGQAFVSESFRQSFRGILNLELWLVLKRNLFAMLVCDHQNRLLDGHPQIHFYCKLNKRSS